MILNHQLKLFWHCESVYEMAFMINKPNQAWTKYSITISDFCFNKVNDGLIIDTFNTFGKQLSNYKTQRYELYFVVDRFLYSQSTSDVNNDFV